MVLYTQPINNNGPAAGSFVYTQYTHNIYAHTIYTLYTCMNVAYTRILYMYSITHANNKSNIHIVKRQSLIDYSR